MKLLTLFKHSKKYYIRKIRSTENKEKRTIQKIQKDFAELLKESQVQQVTYEEVKIKLYEIFEEIKRIKKDLAKKDEDFEKLDKLIEKNNQRIPEIDNAFYNMKEKIDICKKKEIGLQKMIKSLKKVIYKSLLKSHVDKRIGKIKFNLLNKLINDLIEDLKENWLFIIEEEKSEEKLKEEIK